MLRIISVHINDSRFVYYQKKLLDKFIADPFEFIVFDDSGNSRNTYAKNIDPSKYGLGKSISEICNDLGVTRVNVPPTVHENPSSVHPYRNQVIDHPGEWCANSLQYAINYCKENYSESDIIVNIDSDMFPVIPLDINEYLGEFNLSGSPQIVKNESSNTSIEYIWNGLFFFRPKNIDWALFYWDTCDISDDLKITTRFSGIHTDVGGLMFFYLRKYPEYKKNHHLCSGAWSEKDSLSIGIEIPRVLLESLDKDPRNNNGLYYSEFYPPGFLHYRAGGNWDLYKDHEKRKENLFKALDELIK